MNFILKSLFQFSRLSRIFLSFVINIIRLITANADIDLSVYKVIFLLFMFRILFSCFFEENAEARVSRRKIRIVSVAFM